MKLTFTGVLTQIYAPTTGQYAKREFVLKVGEPNDQYPNHYKMNVSGKALNYLDNYQVGQSVEVGCYLKGREFNKRDNSGVSHSLELSAVFIKRI